MKKVMKQKMKKVVSLSERFDQTYDNKQDNKFRAKINLGKDVFAYEEVEVSEEDPSCLTYDEVEDAFFKIIDEKYPEKTFPEANIKSIEIFSREDNSWVPVLSEEMKDEIEKFKSSKKFNRFLVLPVATYSLTRESLLHIALVEEGLVEVDKFDKDMMSRILKMIEEK